MSTLPHAPHTLRAMTGRDPHEAHRAATPLELLFDLTFVIGIGAAAHELAHYVAEGHFATGIAGFALAMWAIIWAWINYSWFSSAYDTDDWSFRIATMVVMVGVIVNALGIPTMFKALDEGARLGNGVMVMGYVIMRLAMVFLWFRAARSDSKRRRTCKTYGTFILLAQIGWVVLTLLSLPFWLNVVVLMALFLFEVAAPIVAESKDGGTPWHPHHIAERYSLLAIIALGEGVVGTVSAVSAVVQEQGWSTEAIMICAAGTGLTFAMWWVYFIPAWGKLLHQNRQRSFVWGYGHMMVFAAIAATGAGLDIAALYIEGKSHISAAATMFAVALPVGIYVGSIFLLYAAAVKGLDGFHYLLLALTLAALAASVVMAAMGFSLTICLAVLTLAPAISVFGYETIGFRTAAKHT